MIECYKNNNMEMSDVESQISLEQIKKFRKIYNSDKTNKIIENAITKNGLENACINRDVIIENQPVFNIE